MLHKLTLVLLVFSCAVLGWRVYDDSSRQKQLDLELKRMQEHALNLEKQVLELQQEVRRLEGETVQGMVDDAQQSLFQSWDELLDVFADELEGMRDKLRESLENPEEQNNSLPDGGKRT